MRRPAVTLVEVLVAVAIGAMITAISVQIYGQLRVAIARDQGKNDVVQNARVALDRLARDLRQANEFVTVMPAAYLAGDPPEFEFEDGHADDLTYRRYYIDGSTLKVDTKQYTFSTAPNTRVRWNVVNGSGQRPTATVLSTLDVADGVYAVEMYGTNAEVTIIVTTRNLDGQEFKLRTRAYARNR